MEAGVAAALAARDSITEEMEKLPEGRSEVDDARRGVLAAELEGAEARLGVWEEALWDPTSHA